MIKSYNDLLKENPFATTKVLEDIGDANCPSNDDFLSPNVHHMQSQTVSHLDFYFVRQYLLQRIQYNSTQSDNSQFSHMIIKLAIFTIN